MWIRFHWRAYLLHAVVDEKWIHPVQSDSLTNYGFGVKEAIEGKGDSQLYRVEPLSPTLFSNGRSGSGGSDEEGSDLVSMRAQASLVCDSLIGYSSLPGLG
jgi:hypothetical protein